MFITIGHFDFLYLRSNKNLTKNKKKLKLILTAFVMVLILSCASATPMQVHVKKSQLYNISRIALNISCKELDVKDARYSGPSGATLLLMMLGGGIIFPIAENVIEGAADHGYANRFEGAFNADYFSKVLGEHFLENIRKSKHFDIEYSDKKSYQLIANEGYDAVIELIIDELSLQRFNRDNYKVYASVSANMVELKNEKVIWKRFEHRDSEEVYTLDDYQKENAKILRNVVDSLFNKIAYRLSADILYSK